MMRKNIKDIVGYVFPTRLERKYHLRVEVEGCSYELVEHQVVFSLITDEASQLSPEVLGELSQHWHRLLKETMLPSELEFCQGRKGLEILKIKPATFL